MSGNADEFREALSSGNYDPDEGITDDNDSDTDSSSDSSSSTDFGEELGSGQSTSGGENTDTNQTDSGGSESDSDTSDSALSDEPLDTDTGSNTDTDTNTDPVDTGGGGDGDLQSGTDPVPTPDPPSTDTGSVDTEPDTDTNQTDSDTTASDSGTSDGSSVDSFPTPEEVNQEVGESDTAQSEPELTDTSSGSAQDNFGTDTGSSETGTETETETDTGTDSSSETAFNPSEIFSAENRGAIAQEEGRAPGGGVSVPQGVSLSDRDLKEEAASATAGVQAGDLEVLQGTDGRTVVFSEEATEPDTTDRDVADRRTTEVAETGTADETQITRDATQRTIDPSQVSSIDLGSDNTRNTGTEAREETKEAVTSQLQEQLDSEGVNYNVSEDDVEVVRVGDTLTASLKDESRRQLARQQAFESIKADTGVSVEPDNIRVTETDEGYKTELTEDGKTELAAEGAPLANVPLVGNITQGSAALTSITNRKVVQPVAGSVGSQVEGVGNINFQVTEDGAQISGEEGIGSPFDTDPETAAGTGSEKLTQGAGALVTTPLSLPVLAGQAVEVSGEAAQFTVENPKEAPGAAAGATTKFAKDTARTIINNPLKTTGALIASGGVFAAARRAGPRTSAATRYTIQPGEELLGAGLNRVPRIGNRIAPNSEPIFFSEEAAIRLGKKAGGKIKNRLPEKDPIETETRTTGIDERLVGVTSARGPEITSPVNVETQTETVADVEGEVEVEETSVETDTETDIEAGERDTSVFNDPAEAERVLTESETESETEADTETETVDATVEREQTVVEPQPALPGPTTLAKGTLQRGERVVQFTSGRGPGLTKPFGVNTRAETVGTGGGGRIEAVEREIQLPAALPGPRAATEGLLSRGEQTVGVLSRRTPDVDMPRNIETRTRTVAKDDSFNLIAATEADLNVPGSGGVSTARNRAADVANAARREIDRFRFDQPPRRSTGESSEFIQPDSETVAVVEDGEVQGYVRTTETAGETDTQTDTDLPESDGDATDAETGTVETDQDVGGGQRQIREQRLGESEDTVTRTDRTGTGTDAPTRRFEVADQPTGSTLDSATEPTVGLDVGAEPTTFEAGTPAFDTGSDLGFVQTPGLDSGTELTVGPVTSTDVETEPELENRSETETSTETETETENRTELELEQRQEQEQRRELELFRETETRQESGLFDFDNDPDSATANPDISGVVDPYTTDFRNPLTGNVLETQLDP